MSAALGNKNVEVIQYLYNTFKNKIDLNQQNNKGNTALMLAVNDNKNVEVNTIFM